jgi:hypothetical protein
VIPFLDERAELGLVVQLEEFAGQLPLGRANISTTQRYIHLDDHELADVQGLVD